MKGFGVRVMPTGVKSYVLEYRPGAGGRGVAKKRLTLGKHGLTAEEARSAALDALAGIRKGEDPQADKARQRAAPTVSSLIDAFIAEHVVKKCKRHTAVAHKVALERLRAVHGNMKAEALTRAHVAALHSKLKDSPFAANRFLAVISKMFSWGAQRGLLPDSY